MIFNFQSNIVRGGRKLNTFVSVVLTFILRCYVFCKLIKKKNEKKLFKKKKVSVGRSFSMSHI